VRRSVGVTEHVWINGYVFWPGTAALQKLHRIIGMVLSRSAFPKILLAKVTCYHQHAFPREDESSKVKKGQSMFRELEGCGSVQSLDPAFHGSKTHGS